MVDGYGFAGFVSVVVLHALVIIAAVDRKGLEPVGLVVCPEDRSVVVSGAGNVDGDALGSRVSQVVLIVEHTHLDLEHLLENIVYFENDVVAVFRSLLNMELGNGVVGAGAACPRYGQSLLPAVFKHLIRLDLSDDIARPRGNGDVKARAPVCVILAEPRVFVRVDGGIRRGLVGSSDPDGIVIISRHSVQMAKRVG